MIIVCINNIGFPDELTINKSYNGSKKYITKFLGIVRYYLMNDLGDTFGYDGDRFITLEEYRETQIDNVLMYD